VTKAKLQKLPRLIGIDLLRGVIIVIAVVIHIRWRSDWFISYRLHDLAQATVTVGEFFVFTAGFMGHYQYAHRFLQSKRLTSLRLWRKAFAVFTYFAVTSLAWFVTLGEVVSWVPLVAQLTTSILFIFTLVYLLSPLLLYLLSTQNLRLPFSIVTIVISIYFVLHEWVIGSVHPNIYIIRYGVGGFSIIPLLGLYTAGFWSAYLWFKKGLYQKNWIGLGLFMVALTGSWYLLRGPVFSVLARYLWLYVLLPGFFWITMGFESFLRQWFEKDYIVRFVAMLGAQSLVFFTVGNILIYLTPHESYMGSWMNYWLVAILFLSAFGASIHQQISLKKRYSAVKVTP